MSAAAAPASPRSGPRLGIAPRGTRVRDLLFQVVLIMALAIAVIALVTLIYTIIKDGAGQLSSDFFTNFASSFPRTAGIQAALTGTLWLMAVCIIFIVPVGVASAVYLEEYADRDKWWNRLIEVNIQNLAAVPSIVYGILGLAFLVRGPLSLGRVVLAGGLTLGLLVLPVVIITGREAIRAVPSSIREGSLALGATQWQTIWRQVLPGSVPGIATGVILALSRAIGETAPLILIGAPTFIAFNAHNPFTDTFTALPLQIFSWLTAPQDAFRLKAAGAIIVLFGLLLMMNAVAIWLRNRYESKW